MLYISWQKPKAPGVSVFDRVEHQWHTGEPLPEGIENQQVVLMQADGDELDVILNALKREKGAAQSIQAP